MSPTVLDSSALLAWLRNEPGTEQVQLGDAVMSTVNWSESAQKIAQRGDDAARTLHRISVAGVHIEGFTVTDALRAADMWKSTKAAGLSLGDRACLALAQRLELPALTADQTWSDLDLPVDVQLIRSGNNNSASD